jgi:hypothetical protein
MDSMVENLVTMRTWKIYACVQPRAREGDGD